MNVKRRIAVAGLAIGLAGGAAAGVALGVPGLAGAQTTSTTPAPPAVRLCPRGQDGLDPHCTGPARQQRHHHPVSGGRRDRRPAAGQAQRGPRRLRWP